jgi:hypothetical protein
MRRVSKGICLAPSDGPEPGVTWLGGQVDQAPGQETEAEVTATGPPHRVSEVIVFFIG